MLETNPQLSIYGLSGVRLFNVMGDLKTVRTVIVQPRLNHISERVQTVEQIEEFAVEVAAAAAATHQADAPLVPSSKGCRWCKAKAKCPAIRDEVYTQTAMQAESADSEELAIAMSKVDLIEGWCKAVRAETERRLLAGESVNGFKLVQGKRGNRAWKSKEEAESLLKTMRVPHDRMYDYSVISPTTADALAKEGVIGPRQWPRVQALITQSEGKPSVAPVSDKRPAISVEIKADAFADLTSETSV